MGAVNAHDVSEREMASVAKSPAEVFRTMADVEAIRPSTRGGVRDAVG